MAIIIGIPLLVFFMLMVMGIPFVHCLKLDRAYEATHGQADDVRLKVWYGYQ